MGNLEKYNNIFMECFNLTKDQLALDIKYNTIEAWDSVGHMAMIAEMEDIFDIMLDTTDVVDFSSYEIGKEILKKYGIEFN